MFKPKFFAPYPIPFKYLLLSNPKFPKTSIFSQTFSNTYIWGFKLFKENFKGMMRKVEVKTEENEHLYRRETIINLPAELFEKARKNGKSRTAILKKVVKTEVEKVLKEIPLPLKVKAVKTKNDRLIVSLDGSKLLKEALKIAKKHHLRVNEQFLDTPDRILRIIFELEGIDFEKEIQKVENVVCLFSAVSYYDEMAQQQIIKSLEIKNTETGEEFSLFKPALTYVGMDISSTDWLSFKKTILSNS
jgi:hypothetical protein